MGIVRAVCTSLAKGTQKTNVKSAEFIEDFGIKEDAPCGKVASSDQSSFL